MVAVRAAAPSSFASSGIEAIPREIRDLARIRFDREHGAGSFDDIVALFSNPRGGSGSRFIAGMLDKDIAEAERTFRDMATVLRGAVSAPNASPWARAVLANPLHGKR